jgi:hypothetical protein
MTPILSYQATGVTPEIVTVVKTHKGTYTPIWSVDFGSLTQDQQEDFIAQIESDDPCPYDFEQEEYRPHFRTVADAKEYADALNEESSIAAELQAFHAPSECYSIAMGETVSRLEAARAKAV